MSRYLGALTVAALLGVGTESFCTVVEPRFAESVFFDFAGLPKVTSFAWAPDASGRLFVGLKDGTIRILKNGVLQPAPFLTVEPAAFTAWECGLTGFCFDPNFMKNGHVYVLVTTSGTEQKILRYEAKGDVASNKTELITGLPTRGIEHDGGALLVGSDGKLYWGIGDCGVSLGVDSDLTVLGSKIGRANLDGLIPSDNPFVDGPGGNNDYIWARGFRNPFKATVQPFTGALWVNVTGGAYEQMFKVEKGDHAGWITYEGNQPQGYIKPKIKYATGPAQTFAMTSVGGTIRSNNISKFKTYLPHGFGEGQKLEIKSANNQSFNGTVYVASILGPTEFTANQPGTNAVSGGGSAVTAEIGRALTGGTFYNATGFPPSYRNDYFFGDYSSGKIHRARLNSSNQVSSIDLFATGLNALIDMTTGPDGALYYIGHWGNIVRTRYVSTNQNLVVSPAYVNMAEGGTAVFHVSLAIAPPGNVNVGISKLSGASSIVASNTALTFTRANFSVPQPVFLSAQADTNSSPSRADFALSAAGVTSETVTVNAFDYEANPIRMSGVSTAAGKAQVKVLSPAGLKLVMECSTNFLSWKPFSTNSVISNSVSVFDLRSSNEATKFYRAVNRP